MNPLGHNGSQSFSLLLQRVAIPTDGIQVVYTNTASTSRSLCASVPSFRECPAIVELQKLVQIFPFQESVYTAWKHLQKSKRNKRTQAAKPDEAECFLSTWQETLARLETHKCASQPWLTFSLVTWYHQISPLIRGPNSFSGCRVFLYCHFCAAILPTSQLLCLRRKQKKILKNHGLLEGRHNQTSSRKTSKDTSIDEAQTRKPPCSTAPLSLMRTYNSALTSSSGHPVGLLTMIAEVCPPCHYWNMETASFQYWSHCFLMAKVELGHADSWKAQDKIHSISWPDFWVKQTWILTTKKHLSAFDMYTWNIDFFPGLWGRGTGRFTEVDTFFIAVSCSFPARGRQKGALWKCEVDQEALSGPSLCQRHTLTTSHLVWSNREAAKVTQQVGRTKAFLVEVKMWQFQANYHLHVALYSYLQ